ncbi:MAG: hypothetical protein HYR96_06810 [Deltaproteobacteria bacterium]|nr:hypothetical protein [Deltaproteobacteria bacterium]MBI3294173.1 hypothetical protein [Deltaproteobacteria bacterium]
MRYLAFIHRNLDSIAIEFKGLVVLLRIHIIERDSLKIAILRKETYSITLFRLRGIPKGARLKIKVKST